MTDFRELCAELLSSLEQYTEDMLKDGSAMTDRTLSPSAQAVITASNCAGSRVVQLHIAAALRAAVAQTQLYKGNDCFGDEVWTCDSDELLAIAAELEGQ